jgi:hypothetical protein
VLEVVRRIPFARALGGAGGEEGQMDGFNTRKAEQTHSTLNFARWKPSVEALHGRQRGVAVG